MCFIQVTKGEAGGKNTGYMTETERERRVGNRDEKSLKRKVLESLLGVSFW